MDRISIRHPASYAEGSQIGEETKIAVDYLRYLSAHFKQMAALIRILPEDVSDLGIGVAPVDVFYSLETPELSEALGDVRRSARALREVLENREPKSRPDTELEGQSSSGLWLDYLYILDEVLPADDGLLERFRWLPIITDQADSDVLALFINVAGTKDVVARDQHGVGWHYHYCSRKGERSDTLLAFDAVPSAPTKPLFWELHAEGKAAFQARAGAWGTDRRKNVHAACEPDVIKRNASEFRRPQRGAQAVWPIGAVLNAQVVPVSTSRMKK